MVDFIFVECDFELFMLWIFWCVNIEVFFGWWVVVEFCYYGEWLLWVWFVLEFGDILVCLYDLCLFVDFMVCGYF